MATYGSQVIPQNANILHHCNTGALATVDIGTALGVIYGKEISEDRMPQTKQKHSCLGG